MALFKRIFPKPFKILMLVGLDLLILFAYRPWLIAYCGRDTAMHPCALSACHTGCLHAMQVGEPHRIEFL